ncbi:UNVERIFIED_CONTAM: hypothetical protein GTU68_012287 [Idotea baltica]|nr:hypothetical protein [Idotea baltica]
MLIAIIHGVRQQIQRLSFVSQILTLWGIRPQVLYDIIFKVGLGRRRLLMRE